MLVSRKIEQPKQKTSGKLALILYPFTWGAVAINLFMLSLAWQWIGWEALTPVNSMAIAVLLAIPANWAVTRWVQSLIAEAEK